MNQEPVGAHPVRDCSSRDATKSNRAQGALLQGAFDLIVDEGT